MIQKENLKNRGIYKIKSRNLNFGVWNSNQDGFVGIRTKFGARFLFTEYLSRECGGVNLGFDTATPIEFLEDVPEQFSISDFKNKELQEYLESKGYL